MTDQPPNDQHIILFDGHCSLCRSLASFGARISPQNPLFQSWEDFTDRYPHLTLPPTHKNELRFWDGQNLYHGLDAWQKITDIYPGLKQIQWLAHKINRHQDLPKALHQSSTRLSRILCRKCHNR